MNKSMNKFEDLESKKSRFDLESVSSDEDSNIEGDDDPSSSKDQAEKIKAQLAKRETAQVFRLRLLVFLVLAMAAA